jgi:hypothetical protein
MYIEMAKTSTRDISVEFKLKRAKRKPRFSSMKKVSECFLALLSKNISKLPDVRNLHLKRKRSNL